MQDVHDAALLCTHAYVLLARRATWTKDEQDERAAEAEQWKLLKSRLQRAEAGQWVPLAQEMLAEFNERAEASALWQQVRTVILRYLIKVRTLTKYYHST